MTVSQTSTDSSEFISGDWDISLSLTSIFILSLGTSVIINNIEIIIPPAISVILQCILVFILTFRLWDHFDSAEIFRKENVESILCIILFSFVIFFPSVLLNLSPDNGERRIQSNDIYSILFIGILLLSTTFLPMDIFSGGKMRWAERLLLFFSLSLAYFSYGDSRSFGYLGLQQSSFISEYSYNIRLFIIGLTAIIVLIISWDRVKNQISVYWSLASLRKNRAQLINPFVARSPSLLSPIAGTIMLIFNIGYIVAAFFASIWCILNGGIKFAFHGKRLFSFSALSSMCMAFALALNMWVPSSFPKLRGILIGSGGFTYPILLLSLAISISVILMHYCNAWKGIERQIPRLIIRCIEMLGAPIWLSLFIFWFFGLIGFSTGYFLLEGIWPGYWFLSCTALIVILFLGAPRLTSWLEH